MTAAEDFSFVVCVNNVGYPASLELHKVLRVLSDEDTELVSDIRGVDESGEDYLYSAEQFATVSLSLEARRSLLEQQR